MKISVLKIYQRERAKGRGFMKRMKEAWDMIYDDMPMSAQTLRDNAARFQKDKALLNSLEVRDGENVEPEISQPVNVEGQKGNQTNQLEEEAVVNDTSIEGFEESDNEYHIKEEDDETRELRLKFEEILNTLKSTTKDNIEESEPLMKLKKGVFQKQKLKGQTKCLRKG